MGENTHRNVMRKLNESSKRCDCLTCETVMSQAWDRKNAGDSLPCEPALEMCSEEASCLELGGIELCLPRSSEGYTCPRPGHTSHVSCHL